MISPGMRWFNKYLIIIQWIAMCFCRGDVLAQTVPAKPGDSVTIVAGPQYAKSAFHQSLFGKHYRVDWTTPAVLPVIYLDTLAGGVRPYLAGGGRQTKTLRLKDKAGKEYVLRSIDKSYGRAIPDIYHGSFVEDLFDDQVSSLQPYSAVIIPGLAEAAKIYHTTPLIGYVPVQDALDTFNTQYGNALYLFEQRPDENWEEAGNLANSHNIVGTEKLFEKILEDNDNLVDQQIYIRARLFDMWIGDWGRHEDQWRWAETKKGDRTIYKPIPRDRDQAFTMFDGLVLRFVAMDHHQSFKKDIKDVQAFNYAARDLDRRMANETTLEDWLQHAKDMQQLLTDEVIDRNVKKLPPSSYAISGHDIAEKLKSRRNHLHEYAETYYRFLAEEVDIPGTEKREKFIVSRLNDNETRVDVYKITKKDDTQERPLYSRIFRHDETREIRLYGLGGNDIYHVQGKTDKGIKVRLIGGPDHDHITDASRVEGTSQKTIVYDNPGNSILRSPETRLKISQDTGINAYNYHLFNYDKKGLRPIAFYNNVDRFHVGIGYKLKENRWRKEPAHEQRFLFRYSISQNAIGATYRGLFYQFPGKWNLEIVADYDAIRWTNFFGQGNETKRVIDDRNYYRVRNSEILFSTGLRRNINNKHDIRITPQLQAIRVRKDPGRYLESTIVPNSLRLYERHYYAGGAVDYAYTNVDDIVVPTKGLGLFAGASYTHNLEYTNRSFMRYTGGVQLYIPLLQNLSLVTLGGITTVTGDPEFYQYPTIGGSRSFRGFRRDRFRGNTAFYNNNELQWVKEVRSKIMNGKAGLVALTDNGRVWLDGEQSDKWHISYGGGVLIAPFNIARIVAAYAVSEDGGRFSLRLTRDISPF